MSIFKDRYNKIERKIVKLLLEGLCQDGRYVEVTSKRGLLLPMSSSKDNVKDAVSRDEEPVLRVYTPKGAVMGSAHLYPGQGSELLRIAASSCQELWEIAGPALDKASDYKGR